MATETTLASVTTPLELTRRALLSAVIFLVPFLSSTLWQGAIVLDEGPDSAVPWIHRVVLFFYPLDLLWIALAVLTVPVAVSIVRARAFTWAVIATTVFAAAGALSWAFHPSPQGAALVVRWIGLIAIAVVASQLDKKAFRIHVAAPLLATAVIQVVIALWQHPGPGAEGVTGTGQPVAYGSAGNSFVVAFVLLLALTVAIAIAPRHRGRWLWIGGAALCSAGIATSGSRTAFIALLLITIVYAIAAFSDRARYLPAAAASAIPFLAVAAAIPETWLPRLEQSLGRTNNITSGRIGVMRDAASIAADHPQIGVGPGREAFVAEEVLRYRYDKIVWPVHSVPFLAAAELGITMGVAYVAYLLALAWRAIKTSADAIAVFVAVGAWMPLDVHAYLHPTAIVMAAVWVVTLDQLAKWQRLPEETHRPATA
jgi:O-Antigen ligase